MEISIDILSAKPQVLELLLQEERQQIPKTQIAINTTFFIINGFSKVECTSFL